MALIDRWAAWRGWKVDWSPEAAMPLERDWTYTRSRIGHYTRYLRARALLRRGRFPLAATLKPVFPAARWNLYFLYLPDGELHDAHRYTIDRLRWGDARLLLVVASPDPAAAERLLAMADAVVWKGMAGFDFSAYALGIDAVARHSPGAALFVMNDSVFGPFGDLDAVLADAPWALTGFTASKRIENHIQSYAFFLREVTPVVARALRPVLWVGLAYDRYGEVVYAQETRLARIAARRMSVGAFWYSDHPLGDPTLYSALAMMDQGYPFLKRKLLVRHDDMYPRATLLKLLRDHGHPLPPPAPPTHP